MDKPFWQSKKFWATAIGSLIGLLPLVSMLLGGKDLSSVQGLLNTLLGLVAPSVYVGSQALVDSKVYPVKLLNQLPVEKKTS